MNLEEVRRRAVEEELRQVRDDKARQILPAIVVSTCLGFLAYSEMQPPEAWARGDWFKPGGWMHDLLGFDGAVLFLRAATLVALVASLLWLVATFYALTVGLRRRRARIAAEQPRFRGPESQV